MDDSRKAFEDWHGRIFEQHLPSLRGEYGYSTDSIVQTRWQAWQFAWEARESKQQKVLKEVRVGLEALDELVDKIYDFYPDIEELKRYESARKAGNDALASLSQLISQDEGKDYD